MVSLDTIVGLYSEDYDDQEGSEFTFVSYTDLNGQTCVDEIGENLAGQVHELRRKYGSRSQIKVYR